MTFVDSWVLVSCRIFSSLFIKRSKILCVSASRFHMDLSHGSKLTKMDLAKVPPIVNIYRQALRTFDNSARADFPNNLNKLKSLVDGLRAEHLGFDKTMNSPELWETVGKAPCTYIEVFQNELINMSIFVLKPNFKMPLHDHPSMHGLLKVISGAVCIRGFSEFPVNEAKTLDFAARAKYEAARLAHGIHKRRRLFAQVTVDRVCRDDDETCVLTPTLSNYHEIQALNMPAAFFDILAPPYDTLIEDIGPRRCKYYHINNEISYNLVELQESDVPDCFFCDQAPYLGPVLK